MENVLDVECLGRGFAWLDTGTVESLHQAACFVQSIQTLQQVKIACLEEIALRQHWISKEQLRQHAISMGSNEYAAYLCSLLDL
jgi:glucose-1-phosphate thymidylyltransferase